MSKYSRWLALAEVLCAAASGLLWIFIAPGEWWPVLIALAPWILKPAFGLPLFRRTPFDLPVGLFLLTAGVAMFVSYEAAAAQTKFWVLVSAVFLYYAIVNQPKPNLSGVAVALALVGAVLGGYFVLTHSWVQAPADVQLITSLGLALMRLRPVIVAPALHPNLVGGILATILPISLVLALETRSQRGRFLLIGLLNLWIMLCLLLTSSRAAWFALGLGLTLWYFWRLLPFMFPIDWRVPVFRVITVLLMAAAFISVLVLAETNTALNSITAVEGSTQSRLVLVRDTLLLIRDFVFTGGGLQSFPGLYSQYMLSIPIVKYSYSHNLYTDIGLEQGIFGLLAFSLIAFGAFWRLPAALDRIDHQIRSERRFGMAVFTALVVMLIHGLMDDALYGNFGTPLVLIFPALAAAVILNSPPAPVKHIHADTTAGRARLLALPVTLAAVTIGVLLNLNLLLSLWYSNLGAVEMAKIQLHDFPAGQWEADDLQPELSAAQAAFEQSLVYNYHNGAAHYRLGMMSSLLNDFPTALMHYEEAYYSNPNYYGIRKNLGYTYTWTGSFPQAQPLLRSVPEATLELEAYAWWWEQQGYPDISKNARDMLKVISRLNAEP